MEQLRLLGDSSPTEFNHQLASWHQWHAAHFETLQLQTLYNPVGKSMLGMAASLHEYYPIRAQELAALERAVELAYQIRMNRVDDKDIPAYIASHPALSIYPAAGLPLSWDASRHQISVHALANTSSQHRFTIPLWHSHLS